jgi:hypothetical protein
LRIRCSGNVFTLALLYLPSGIMSQYELRIQ